MSRKWLVTCLVVGAVWTVGSFAWLYWVDWVELHNVIAIACGYPNTVAKGYASCVMNWSGKRSVWTIFFYRDWLWVVLPPTLLFLAVVAKSKITGTVKNSN